MDLFSTKTNKILNEAQIEARCLYHKYIGTEHMLLALAKSRTGIVGEIFEEMNLDYNILRLEIRALAASDDPRFIDRIDYTPLAKLVKGLAFEEAKKLGFNQVEPGHLLMAILNCPEGLASRVLKKMKVDIHSARSSLLKKLARNKILSTHFSPKTSSSSFLMKFCRDLTDLTSKDKLDPVIGRKEKISRLVKILCRRTKNNPCLIGEPGVGKSSIVRGLAALIASKDVPESLLNTRILELNMANIIAGAKFRGEFEERIQKMVNEIKQDKNIILFIDEAHTLVGTGAMGGSMDAASAFKPPLARGEIRIIGCTTPDNYRKYIEHDKNLERRFSPIKVEEPEKDETVQILLGLKEKYEKFHSLEIPENVIRRACLLSERFLSDRFQPEKTIDVLDEACAEKSMKLSFVPQEIKELKWDIEKNSALEQEYTDKQEYTAAAKVACRNHELTTLLKEKNIEWQEELKNSDLKLTEEDIANVIAEWTGIPAGKLSAEESEKMIHLEAELHKRIVGQDMAVKGVAQAVRRARAGLQNPRRPLSSFIFLGPTGVGKTELAKTLAEEIFGRESALIRVDMSEYMEKHSVSRLVGAPPGYIGHDEAGQLTERVRQNPYSVVLFDEIEKAHKEVFNILLQILEEGRLTDSQGRTVNFKNTLLIMTSNLGTSKIGVQNRIGYVDQSEEDAYDAMREKVMSELKKSFRPEFINRLDEIIVFHKLDKFNLSEISRLMLADLGKRLEEKSISIEYDENVITYLVEKDFDPAMGARPLRRTIQRCIENELANLLLSDDLQPESIIRVSFDSMNEKLEFEVENSAQVQENVIDEETVDVKKDFSAYLS
jgi:ATP-dependent Clp protease ATP-binding subunit ClpC